MAQIYHRDPSKSANKFIHRVSPVKAYDFYGYSMGWRCFAKIELLNPSYMLKCADILLNGSVMGGLSLQSYETHIPYTLAFMADYNLNGCDWMVFDNFYTRSDRDRTAYSGTEIDIDAKDIRNRTWVQQETKHHSLFEQSHDEVKISSLRELWEIDATRRSQSGQKPYVRAPDIGPRVHDDKWERYEEFRTLLSRRLAPDKPVKQRQNCNWAQLPTSFEAVMPKPVVETRDKSQSQPFKLPKRRIEYSQAALAAPVAKTSSSSFSFSFLYVSELSNKRRRTDENQISIGGRPLRYRAPSTAEVEASYGVVAESNPFYDNPKDVSLFPYEFAGTEYHVKSHRAKDLPKFQFSGAVRFTPLASFTATGKRSKLSLELSSRAPSRSEVEQWMESTKKDPKQTSQVAGSVTFLAPSMSAREVVVEDLSILALEVHVQTRPQKVPFAKLDPVTAVFWYLASADESDSSQEKLALKGVITVTPIVVNGGNDVVVVDDEVSLLNQVVAMVRHFDPDILCGYETNSLSWGYLEARYAVHHSTAFYNELGRVEDSSPRGILQEPIRGRHLMSLWQVLRSEFTLLQYTLEHVVFHTLHERTPHFSFDNLTAWWDSVTDNRLVVSYWTQRVEYVIRLIHHSEIVSRYCTQARLIGVDFWSALTRGSQFMVESVLCRLSKRENYLLISPSKRQVAQQNALEYIPLVMEPKSAFYSDPVCVLDFRSLYPSIVIAYNLCYSTCIGRLDLWRGRNKLGVIQDHYVDPELLSKLRDHIYIAPNGIGYVKPNVRKSLVAQMLSEILDTRFMINDSRKQNKTNTRVQRNLNNQQLALKFIANVTYGYTSASFSGRMPCAELADSIVLTGREILTRSIKMIESTTKWQGTTPQVVYGDTDSLFVRVPNVSREQAFRIGHELAEMVTRANRTPILLKLEKVYHPCILQTKKRYVGRSYETATSPPMFDAKGTETVRRDGAPIIQKLERKALDLLFDGDHDLSRVKQYLQNQWRRILTGKVPLQDFCFAQQVKLGAYKSNDLADLPGGAVVSLKKLQKDEGNLPQYKERVPFVVVAEAPGSRIVDRCVSPQDALANPHTLIDAEYYITRVIIPPLERLFNMIGVNIRDWYSKMPRGAKLIRGTALGGHVTNKGCVVCLERPAQPSSQLCAQCEPNKPRTTYILLSRSQIQQRNLATVRQICHTCSGKASPACESLDCPLFYERKQTEAEAQEIQTINDLVLNFDL